MSEPKTDAQRNSIHLWQRQVAELLNEHGIERRIVIEKLSDRGLDMPWDDVSFKALVYKPVFQAVTLKNSTEDANRTDHNICYEGLCRWFGQEFGLTLPPFPSRESL